MKVSVVTVCYNSEEFIWDAINSVNIQDYENIEHVIVDGNSSDNTLDLVKENVKRDAIIISENDSGIYDAWNKAVRMATGDIICFCNSDDFWSESYVSTAMENVKHFPKDIVFGDVIMTDKTGTIFSKKETSFFNKDNIYRGFNFRTTSVFIPKRIFDRIGLFHEGFRIAGDTEWLLRAYKNSISFYGSNHFVYMRDGGISNMLEYEAYLEYFSALGMHDERTYKSYWVLLKKLLKKKMFK